MTGSYEDPTMVAAYVLFHYGSSADALGSLPGPANATEFPRRCVTELLDAARLPSRARALDLGCAVGGSTFELSRTCATAIGLDYSAAFVETAQILQRDGRMPIELIEMAGVTRGYQAQLPAGVHPERIRFQIGDAMQLSSDLGPFDVVLAANLLCRLSEPLHLLDRLPGLISSGGQLLLTTPFTWLEAFTPQKNWILGAEALTEILHPHFALDHQIELPFLLREHARKFQYGIAWGSRWIRR